MGNNSNLSPELEKKLKNLGIQEGDSKEQIIKILSENNVGFLRDLLSDPSLDKDLKKAMEGALGDFSSSNPAQSYVTDNLNKRNNPGKDNEINNSAIAKQIGSHFAGGGVRNIDQPKSPENTVNKDTMFAEGSIGKVRYAGLAYMLEQAGIFGEKGLQQNAKEFFSQDDVGKFLEKKYPGKNLQKAIVNLFTDGSEKATLADLTTHRSGIGDTTLDGIAMIKTRGIEYPFTLPDLVLPQPESVVPRNTETGKPMARKGLQGNLARAIYGEHEYSNLGYNILAAAMEAAYFISKGVEKDYQKLTEDFMLRPTEGRAEKSDLSFGRTKFPKDLGGDDNVIQAKLFEKNKEGNDVVVNVNQNSSLVRQAECLLLVVILQSFSLNFLKVSLEQKIMA